jgi:hypothetical protein
VSGIKGYTLVYDTSSIPASCDSGTQIYSGTGTSYSHSSLTNGVTYYYRICAADEAGNTSAGATADATPVSSPKSVSSSEGGGCFIATAAYGSYMADEVKILREFRDKYLLTNSIGRKFVIRFYYRYSPPIAKYIAKYELLKAITRIILLPMIYSIKYPFILAGILLIGGLALVRRGSSIRDRINWL